MLNKTIANMKDTQRKLQSETESLIRAQEHSLALIKSLEHERDRLQFELTKFSTDGNASLFTNKALVSKDKALHSLAQFELQSINKINKADVSLIIKWLIV